MKICILFNFLVVFKGHGNFWYVNTYLSFGIYNKLLKNSFVVGSKTFSNYANIKQVGGFTLPFGGINF